MWTFFGLDLLQLTLVGFIGILGYLALCTLNKKKDKNLPPCYEGWLPWLGCGLEARENPLRYIKKKNEELGPVFTLMMGGERITFLFDWEDALQLYTDKADLSKAVEPMVRRLVVIKDESVKCFSSFQEKYHSIVKGRLSQTNMEATFKDLYEELQLGIQKLRDESLKKPKRLLYKDIKGILYRSTIHLFCGKENQLTDTEDQFNEFERRFLAFDEQFEYGSKYPAFLLRKWADCRDWLLEKSKYIFDANRKTMPEDAKKKNLCQHLLSVFDDDTTHRMGLLLIWASLANAIPMALWCLTLIYNDKKILAKVQQEVDRVYSKSEKVSQEDLAQLPFLKQCIFEGLRIHAVGLLPRVTVKPMTVKGYDIPVGSLIAMSPFWLHRDPERFPDPDMYKPERWEGFEGLLPKSLVVFGGGRFMCPGRWFGMLEIQLIVSMFLYNFNCELLEGVPEACEQYFIGIQTPLSECPVSLSLRH